MDADPVVEDPLEMFEVDDARFEEAV